MIMHAYVFCRFNYRGCQKKCFETSQLMLALHNTSIVIENGAQVSKLVVFMGLFIVPTDFPHERRLPERLSGMTSRFKVLSDYDISLFSTVYSGRTSLRPLEYEFSVLIIRPLICYKQVCTVLFNV